MGAERHGRLPRCSGIQPHARDIGLPDIRLHGIGNITKTPPLRTFRPCLGSFPLAHRTGGYRAG